MNKNYLNVQIALIYDKIIYIFSFTVFSRKCPGFFRENVRDFFDNCSVNNNKLHGLYGFLCENVRLFQEALATHQLQN